MLGYPDGYTKKSVFDTDDDASINKLSREDFMARVNAKKQDLELFPAQRRASESEVAERRERRAAADAARAAERAAEAEDLLALERRTEEEQNRLKTIGTLQKYQAEREANDGKVLTFQLHAGCPVAFPKQNLHRNLFRHLTAHNPGTNQQGPTPMHRSSVFCPSLTACTACQDWVQELARGTASVGLPGASWAHKRHAVLKVAREVRAAFPSITFGDVDLHVAGPSKRGATAPPPRSSKRARQAPKKMDS